MNKILFAFTIAICLCLNALAQKTHKPARISYRKKAIVKDTVIFNFKVCKSESGYAICGETPGNTNSTFEEPPKPRKHPVFEADRSDIIALKTIPLPPKVTYPMDKNGPETQSGAWFGISSWCGIW